MSLLVRTRRMFGAVFILFGVACVFAVGAIAMTDRAGAASLVQSVASAISCSSTGTAACFSATNTSSGVAVYGTSKSGTGLRGLSTSNYGLKATSTSGVGVYGQSSSGTAGVVGSMTSGTGVYGYTTGGSQGTGVYGSSAGGAGVYGASTTSDGVVGVTSSSGGAGVFGQTGAGYGVSGISNGGTAVYGYDSAGGTGVDAYSYTGDGVDVYGGNIGVYVTAPAGTDAYPIYALGGTQTAFYVNGDGDVYIRGNTNSVASMHGGSSATAFTTKTTAPTLEDTGTAQLVGGVSAVRIDPTFAATIDTSTPYRVFLTPAGDSRGLYVASRNMAGFIVRESQGGRSSMSFDYRIVAAPIGHARERMARITRDAPGVVPHVSAAATFRHAVAPPRPPVPGRLQP